MPELRVRRETQEQCRIGKAPGKRLHHPMFTAPQIEALRLAEIAYLRRLTGARAAPVNAPSEWIGWSIITPDGDRRRHLRRLVDGLCTRCGGRRPRPERKTCARCAAAQRVRAAALRARRRAAGRCVDCNAPAAGATRCARCASAYRVGGRWSRRPGATATVLGWK